MPALFSKVAVVGVGLIGGSFGMALRRTNLASEIIGVDLCAETLRLAVEREAIDQGFYELSLGVKDADLVVLAAPISYNLELLQKMKPYLKEGAIVTDVGSTKGDFVQKAELLLSPDQFFVGGHPMAGSEIGGIKRADPYLFENAYYLLTVTEKTDPKALDLVKSLAEGIGGRVLLVDPDDHDLMAAAISHLPHLIASTLVNTAAEINEKLPRTFSLAAGGFRDTTRIASGDPTLWKDICFNNKDKLLELIAIFKKELALFEQYLEQNDLVSFEKELAQAKELEIRFPLNLRLLAIS